MSTPIDHALLAKYLAEECSSAEKKQVEDWLRASPDNQTYLDQVRQLWLVSNTIQEVTPDVDQVWLSLQDRLSAVRPLTTPHTPTPISSWYSWAGRIAALLLLALTLLLLVYFYVRRSSPSTAPASLLSISTDSTQKQLVLEDGTKIYLNRFSRLKYPASFSHTLTRQVYLEGEAYFEVHKDASHPFLVHTRKTQTRVLGTAFSISTSLTSDTVLVGVAEGKVSFAAKAHLQDTLLLLPQELGVMVGEATPLAKKTITDPNFFAWQTGDLLFQQTPLPEVIQTLNRHYHSQIRIQESKLLRCRLTARFSNKSLSEVLTILGLTLDIQTERHNQEIWLLGKGC